jgi:thiamine-phosphate pyrophosphorylase
VNITPPLLMVVTDPIIPDMDARLDAALSGVAAGPVWVQYRDKTATTEERIDWLLGFRDRHPHCCLLVNEDLAAAERAGADGVHLSSLSSHPGHVWACNPRLARAALGEDAIIGRSAHPENLIEPAAFGAELDYLMFGTVFPSESHPGGQCTGTQGLHYACEEARLRGRNLPIIAIGGITVQNAGECIRAGAAGVASIRAVLLAEDPAAVVAHLYEAMRAAMEECG